jgi:DNA replication and repair protein RecF
MYLKHLSLVNFKNYFEADLHFSTKLNCFLGNNGVGKTNMLDAIHYLSLTKSYFNSIDSQNIQYGQQFFVIHGTFERKEQEEIIYCAMQRGKGKQFKRNKKEYDKLSSHIGLFPVVMISPSDIGLILDGSEERRKFINSVISQYDGNYLEDTINYARVLAQRNKLLKEVNDKKYRDPVALEIWDEQLISIGNRMFDVRKLFIEQLEPVFQKYYEFVSNGREKVKLTYKSDLLQESFSILLKKNREKDFVLQYTSSGVHRDDLIFSLGDHPIKKHGSQGQQKTFLVALKLAKLEFIQSITGFTPLLLLDDVFDKFDQERVKQIIKLVAEKKFGQIFLTDTLADRLEGIFKEVDIEHKIFLVNEGQINEK